MSTATPTASRYTTCTGTSCYGLCLEGTPLTCPNCGGTALLYPRRAKLAVKRALLRQLADGRIQALSSDGETVYDVRIGVETSCTCPAGRNGRRCYHITTAQGRFAAFWPRPVGISPIPPDRQPTPIRPGLAAHGPSLAPGCDCPSCSRRPVA